MNFWDIVKNPIIIGLFAGVLTYVYMEWKNAKDYKKSKNKNKKKKEVNLLIPLGVFIVFWFIAYAYLSSDAGDTNVATVDAKEQIKRDLVRDLNAEQMPKYKFKKDGSDTSEPLSFNLVSGGIQIPTTLPDILFEVK